MRLVQGAGVTVALELTQLWAYAHNNQRGSVPRPAMPRRICCRSDTRGFKPIGRPACAVGTVTLGLDGLEAIRLADLEGLYQDAAAEQMGVSRQTFARILTSARSAVAECLVQGKALLVAPAPVVDAPLTGGGCPVHGGRRRRGRQCHCGSGPFWEQAARSGGDPKGP
jgi:uncharacterized protein